MRAAAALLALALAPGAPLPAQGGWIPPQPPCDVPPANSKINNAITALTSAVEKPESRDAQLAQAKRLLTDAIVQDKQSANPAAWYYLGRLAVTTGDVAGADSALARAPPPAPPSAAAIATPPHHPPAARGRRARARQPQAIARGGGAAREPGQRRLGVRVLSARGEDRWHGHRLRARQTRRPRERVAPGGAQGPGAPRGAAGAQAAGRSRLDATGDRERLHRAGPTPGLLAVAPGARDASRSRRPAAVHTRLDGVGPSGGPAARPARRRAGTDRRRLERARRRVRTGHRCARRLRRGLSRGAGGGDLARDPVRAEWPLGARRRCVRFVGGACARLRTRRAVRDGDAHGGAGHVPRRRARVDARARQEPVPARRPVRARSRLLPAARFDLALARGAALARARPAQSGVAQAGGRGMGFSPRARFDQGVRRPSRFRPGRRDLRAELRPRHRGRVGRSGRAEPQVHALRAVPPDRRVPRCLRPSRGDGLPRRALARSPPEPPVRAPGERQANCRLALPGLISHIS